MVLKNLAKFVGNAKIIAYGCDNFKSMEIFDAFLKEKLRALLLCTENAIRDD